MQNLHITVTYPHTHLIDTSSMNYRPIVCTCELWHFSDWLVSSADIFYHVNTIFLAKAKFAHGMVGLKLYTRRYYYIWCDGYRDLEVEERSIFLSSIKNSERESGHVNFSSFSVRRNESIP